uniref:hypothetical protein n=1 Tax=Marinobacterium profundum TaxID=1714300 RepID=UPI00083668AA|nr:hypothetical protein [Marinobacterium profundum]
MSQARRKAWTWIVNQADEGDAVSLFTAVELAHSVGIARGRAKRFIRFLEEHKRVKLVQRGGGPVAATYRVISTEPLQFDKRASFTRANSARQRIWNSCRILRTFSLAELAATSQAAYATCCAYIKRLERVGLVRKVKRHAPEHGNCALFRLNIDVGHAHPIVRNDGVFCPARNTLYPYKETRT